MNIKVTAYDMIHLHGCAADLGMVLIILCFGLQIYSVSGYKNVNFGIGLGQKLRKSG